MLQQMLVFLLLLFISPSISDRISLAGDDWTITNHINYTAQGRVPGTIHTILFAANQTSDPYAGFNDVDLRFLIHSNWTFTKKFNLTANFLASNETTIHLEQIDTVASIEINTCPIGRTYSMFMSYTFNIPSSCLKSENEIQIDFQSPVQYVLEQAAAYNDTVPPICTPPAQHGECLIQFIRKEPCSFSWDWVRI
jgi:beta-mannosidase